MNRISVIPRAFVALTLLALLSVACGSPPQPNGADLFAANCTLCHGAQADGTLTGPPLVHRLYEPGHHPDLAFQSAVANGVLAHHWDFGDMPPVAGLSQDDVAAITAYVRELQRQAGIGIVE